MSSHLTSAIRHYLLSNGPLELLLQMVQQDFIRNACNGVKEVFEHLEVDNSMHGIDVLKEGALPILCH